MKVLMCDDEQSRFDEVAHAIEESGVGDIEVVPLVKADLEAALATLFSAIAAYLDGGESFTPTSDLIFDTVDLAIIDNNLSHLALRGTRLTAESIAGYIRAFTNVPYIVSLNKNPDVDFDLRYLIGDFETRADIALNTGHLANRAAWTGRSADASISFCPWYWQRLAHAPDRRRKQVVFIEQHLKDSVLKSLDFPTSAEDLGFLSLHAKGALSAKAEETPDGDGIPIADVTFLDVFASRSRSLAAAEERDQLLKKSRAGDASATRMIARVVASDIDLWFRRDVIGPQEMLIDLPHLLTRMPFLLGESAGKSAAWNQVIAATAAPYGTDAELYTRYLAGAKFAHDMWTTSPTYWWPTLKGIDTLGELFFAPRTADWADVVFCEDISAFVGRSASGADQPPIEFSAEFEGSWGRRHVAHLEDVQYAPRSRFAV